MKINLSCKRQCQKSDKEKVKNDRKILPIEAHDEDLEFYEKKILEALCLLQCKFNHPDFFSDDEFLPKDQLYLYESLEPYNYLQLCYYQVRKCDVSYYR